jgi:hypothetical protein
VATPLAPSARLVDDPPVLLILLIGSAPLLIWLTLAIALYLTVIELRELQPHYAWWIWWLLLVFMTHFIGYLILRAYAVYRRWNAARTG